jgi:hypothetical protein
MSAARDEERILELHLRDLRKAHPDTHFRIVHVGTWPVIEARKVQALYYCRETDLFVFDATDCVPGGVK